MGDRISVVLVGIGGYGEVYLAGLLDEPEGQRCRIVGAVDPQPGNCSRLDELRSAGVPVVSTLDEFYATGSADLAVISSPIHLHAEHVCRALEGGSNVLVEKPAAAVTADVDAMIEARDRTGRFVAVGFQWSFAPSILDLKRDILAGRFGKPRAGRAITLWPRPEEYYRRNDWAGRRKDAKGRWILDSPACNAMAHHVHNMLFLFGPGMDRSADIADISVQLARVNDIETFDTVMARIGAAPGPELFFYASHAVAEEETVEPRFALDFGEARVVFPGGNASITAYLRDGSVVRYPSPDAASQVTKLWSCVDAVSGKADIPCGLETARPHTSLVERLDATVPGPHVFDGEIVGYSPTTGGRLRWVKGLARSLEQSFETGEWRDLPGLSL